MTGSLLALNVNTALEDNVPSLDNSIVPVGAIPTICPQANHFRYLAGTLIL